VRVGRQAKQLNPPAHRKCVAHKMQWMRVEFFYISYLGWERRERVGILGKQWEESTEWVSKLKRVGEVHLSFFCTTAILILDAHLGIVGLTRTQACATSFGLIANFQWW